MGRELSERERAVLAFMIDNAEVFPDDPEPTAEMRRAWRAQLTTAGAGRPCGCGECPSIEIEDDYGATPGDGPRWVLNAEAPDAALLLFIDGDRLSYLELAPYGDTPILCFPDVTDISV